MGRITRTLALASLVILSLGIVACGGAEQAEKKPKPPRIPAAQPVLQAEDLKEGTTSVALDEGFLEALESLEVTPKAVGEAKISEKGKASFPVTGGNILYFKPDSTTNPFVQGRLDHEGSGLSLSREGVEVELTDFVVNFGDSVLTATASSDGEEIGENVPLFFLDGSTLEEPQKGKDKSEIVLTGTTVLLRLEAAALLNKTFETSALSEGFKIGVATITLDKPAEKKAPKRERPRAEDDVTREEGAPPAENDRSRAEDDRGTEKPLPEEDPPTAEDDTIGEEEEGPLPPIPPSD